MGLREQPQSPCLEFTEMSEAERPCKALSLETKGPGALLGSQEGRIVGSDPSLSPPTPQPRGLGKTRLHGSPFQVGLGVPRAALPSEGRYIKAAAAGSGCGRGGRALGRWLLPAPFHPGWEPTPREAALGFSESLQARGGRTWGCQAAQSCVTSACHCLSLGLGFSSCPPPSPAISGSGWPLGGVF